MINRKRTEERARKKEITKLIRQDRNEMVSKWVEEDLDIRDQWAGVKRQRTEYKPRPFERRDKNGNEIKLTEQAEATATYLTDKQWGANNKEREMADQISNRKLGKQQEYNIDIITTEEIRKAIK